MNQEFKGSREPQRHKQIAADSKLNEEQTLNTSRALRPGVTDDVGVVAYATLAPACSSQTSPARGLVEGADRSALSTSALVARVYGLVPQAERIKR